MMPVSARLSRFSAKWGTAALRLLPAETAHEVGLWLLEQRVLQRLPKPGFVPPSDLSLRTVVPGIGELAHPIGLAAGFDKNARAPAGFADLGLSFLEIGTVTPLPQPGNRRPRMFRQPAQLAIINRMGFNSDGSHAVAERLRAHRWRHELAPLGVNVGKNKATTEVDAMRDYLSAIETFHDLARFLVVNVSSPNTPGLRGLATPHFLSSLAAELGARRAKVWVKLDPDMPKNLFQTLIASLCESGFGGVLLTNTHRVDWPEAGGQSGHPLAVLSSTCLEWAFEVHQGRLPMVASGGVLSGADVFAKLSRGALAVQIYAALVYRGPFAVYELLAELAAELRLRGFSGLSEAIGSHYLER